MYIYLYIYIYVYYIYTYILIYMCMYKWFKDLEVFMKAFKEVGLCFSLCLFIHFYKWLFIWMDFLVIDWMCLFMLVIVFCFTHVPNVLRLYVCVLICMNVTTTGHILEYAYAFLCLYVFFLVFFIISVLFYLSL